MLVIQAMVWPHGFRPDSAYAKELGGDYDILSVIVCNDGTGEEGGHDEGGVGNYDVYEGHPADVMQRTQYWKHLGRIEGIPRTPAHRVELVRRALELLP